MLTKLATTLIALPFLLIASTSHADQQRMEMVLEIASPLGFDETLDKLLANAKAIGWKTPKKWRKNFQVNLRHVTKVDIGPSKVIEICEPFAAVDLLKHDKYKRFLSMMPCTIAIYEKSDGKVYLSMMNIRAFAGAYPGSPEIQKMVTELAPQMEQMLQMD